MLASLQNIVKRLQATRELEIRESALNEIGISRASLINLSCSDPDSVDRLISMARGSRVSAEVLTENWHETLTLIERCHHCRNTRTCAAYLSGEREGDTPDIFCRNYVDIRDLADTSILASGMRGAK